MRLPLLAAALVFGAAGSARAQPADPTWAPVWDRMIQTVCTDAGGRALPGVTPLDDCPRPRKLREGELLPYHKRDWPGRADRAALPGGYQQSDSVPITTALGPASLQTYDFGDGGRQFGRMDAGDGGQVVFFTPGSASVGVTEDGGAGLQLFLGASCAPVDSWIVVDRSFATGGTGPVVARLTRRADLCARRLNQAFTRWRVTPVTFRVRSPRRDGTATWSTLVSEHFDAADPVSARAMERMYFTQPLGYTRWEAWVNTATRDRAADRDAAARLAESGRCEPQVPAPDAGWIMVDCREWTQLVPPAAAAGDPVFTWLDRLRIAPATAALFGVAGSR